MRTYDGRTAEERVAARRQRIMESGLELFCTLGYSRTSIRAVLRHSKLQDRYFTESFSSLDDLMAGIVKEIYADETTRCRAAVESGGQRRDRAQRMLDVLTHGLIDDPRKGRIKLVESLAAGPLTAQERRRGLLGMAGLVESLLTAGWRDPAVQPAVMAMMLVGGVNQILLNWIDGIFAGSSREDVVEQVLHAFDAVVDLGTGTAPRTGRQDPSRGRHHPQGRPTVLAPPEPTA
ncbi:TetR/AcrR family transcriptional regulator [Streptomyces sp. NPDC059582]|uniref:TetR/AcrR family transcriptional regulator n=1 Tax=Streptomyces sp. NPDC059582 TaxID=3346875 RepID=UPI003699BE86